MRYLIDTNVLSELRRPERSDPRVRTWAAGVTPNQCAISVITVFEIERGIAQVERRDTEQARVLRRWFEGEVIERFRDRVLGIDGAVVLRAARLHVPDPRPERDTFIAATALVHGLTIVTRNAGDFLSIGAPVLNPWISDRPA